jgi:ABC-type Fe3+-hydroxamate transport system substrate-binding protein
MKKHPLIVVLTLAVAAVATAVLVSLFFNTAEPEPTPGRQRIVSLMPPVTETLFEIGAGDLVVGRSDWCKFPPQVENLPKCGSALTPNAEGIVDLQATLILANDSEATARDKLNGLGRSEFMPWLTTEEMIASTRKLGVLTGHTKEADKLADELANVLLVPPPADGPRVLLVMMPQADKIDPVSFLRRNSVHGRMLNAAGGRNAVDEDISGVPEISMERVLELDPDIIIALSIRDDLADNERARILESWRRIAPLSAVKNNKIGVLNGQHFYGAGRRLLRAVKELRAEIERLK